MNDLVVGDESLVSTTRASELSGYSKDYLGQLCREEKLVCRRVSGHWYIDEDSITQYQTEGATTSIKEKTESNSTYGMKVGNVRDDTFSYDGIEFIATSRAAEITGYAQDYVGQLARSGEIEARKVGRRWFVGKKSLIEHKTHSDSMLAAVQAEASGVREPQGEHVDVESESTGAVEVEIHKDVEPGDINFNVRYVSETDQPLVPKITPREPLKETYAPGDIDKVPNHLVGTRSAAMNTVKPTAPRPFEAINSVSREDSKELSNVQTFEPRVEKRTFPWGVVLFLLFTLLLLSLGIYIYFFEPFGISLESLLTAIASLEAVEGLQDSYGHFLPGSDFEYIAN